MKITVLVENNEAPDEPELLPEHGLSVHISFQGNDILFDAGFSDKFSKNAEKLGINLSTVDLAVISHHHYDHGGGLSRFFELNNNAKVYLRYTTDREYYFRVFWFQRRYIGLDTQLFDSMPERFEFVDETTEILPDVYIIPKIIRKYSKPKGNRFLYVRRDSKWQLDDFLHELILVIKESDGLVVFSGCSHNGMLNMIDTVNEVFNGSSIKAVIGGFHLVGLPMFNTMAGSKSDVENIGIRALTYPIESVYSGHCTGQKAFRVLKNVMGEKLIQLHTGAVIEI